MVKVLGAVVAVLFFSGISGAADQTFETASIKANVSGSDRITMAPPARGRLSATNVSLGILMAVAYDVRGFQIAGLPGWAWSEKYDVVARAEGNPGHDQFLSMLQALLAERFHLRMHREARTMKGYALVRDRHGAKALRIHEEACAPDSVCGQFAIDRSALYGARVDMKQLASTLAQQRDVGRPVIDKTGIAGYFDMQLQWGAAAGDEALSVFTALQEQLGLRLDAETVETGILVVDHAERPSAN